MKTEKRRIARDTVIYIGGIKMKNNDIRLLQNIKNNFPRVIKYPGKYWDAYNEVGDSIQDIIDAYEKLYGICGDICVRFQIGNDIPRNEILQWEWETGCYCWSSDWYEGEPGDITIFGVMFISDDLDFKGVLY